ncbi:NAD(P)H-flavin reductase [Clostridium cavendishii DSM 21758]|uniref:NAD(P)H-flavin reductase n=1 Tax=Clostridium cavendishii DSM 21758 TaxID=1121302 RepID=A0A1M6NDP1_9CLOT|nr:NAD(P)H-flavin reductase [Clostridium cavendishii DSM 21758]
MIYIKFIAPHKLTLDLVHPGSYVFIRSDENFYFDVPISIMEADVDNNAISLLIEIRGIKTKKLLNLKKGLGIVIRGPYWNGVFGLKNINSMRNQSCLVLARGIGVAPMLPVIRRLKNENNKVDVILDREPYTDIPAKFLIDKYTPVYEEMSLLNKGKLTDEIKELILRKIKDENLQLIHSAGADILTYKLLDFLDSTGNKHVKVSCCNNAKMCCGEGVCGSCTARFAGHKVKRLCKVQADPRNIFEGRRFI